MEKTVVVFSGGLDSTTLLYNLKDKIEREGGKLKENLFALSFLYGQRHSKEIQCAGQTVKKLGIPWKLINIDFLGDIISPVSALSGKKVIQVPKMEDVEDSTQPPTYVPNRNMILLNIAVSLAESIGGNSVYYGAQAHDLYGYWDCTPDFVERLNHTLNLNRKTTVTIHAPFITLSKGEVVKIGHSLGVPYEDTWSCYNGDKYACGTCPTCCERLKAFEEAGYTDPIIYKDEVIENNDSSRQVK